MSFVTPLESSDREDLILAHLPQVRFLALRMHRRCPRNVEIEDLVSAGTVGLIQAVDRFQPERGLKLKTLAEHRIHGALVDYLRKLDPLPRRVRRFVRQREASVNLLHDRLGRPPEDAELAEALGLSIERYRALASIIRASKPVSLDAVGECSAAFTP